MLPHISRGGVVLVEDVFKPSGEFNRNVHRSFVTSPWSKMQKYISEVSFYQYMTVIEKMPAGAAAKSLERHGTEWQPPSFFAGQAGGR